MYDEPKRKYPSQYKTHFAILTYTAIVLLLGPPSNHLADYDTELPSWYFIMLRWVISIIALVFMYLTFIKLKTNYAGWFWGYLTVLFFFNPIKPLYMPEISWIVYDMIAAFYFYRAYEGLKKD